MKYGITRGMRFVFPCSAMSMPEVYLKRAERLFSEGLDLSECVRIAYVHQVYGLFASNLKKYFPTAGQATRSGESSGVTDEIRGLVTKKEKPKDGRKLTDERIIYALLIVYLLFFLSQTLLLRRSSVRRANLTPFWTIRHALRGDIYRFQLLVVNILLTVPVGYLAAAAAWKRNFTDKRRIFAACVLLFMFVEAAQYITGRGLGEFDDVFHNSLGALIGMVCFYGPLWTYDAMAVILTGGGMLQIVDIIFFGPTKFLRADMIPMQIWIVSSVPTAALTVLIFRQWRLYDTGACSWRELAGRLLIANVLSVVTGLLLIWLVLFPYHLPWYYYVGSVIVQTMLTYFVRETAGFLTGQTAGESQNF